MTILFMGGEMGAFTPAGDENEDISRYDATFSRCAIEADGAATAPDISYIETAHWTAETEGYLHFYIGDSPNSVVTHNVVTLINNSGVEVVRLRTTPITGGYTFTLQYKDAGAAWQTAGTFSTTANGHFDIYWNFDASGGVAMWSGGTKRIDLTATDLSHLAGVRYARLHGWGLGAYYSQVVATDAAEPTIGGRLLTIVPSGAGASSDWTGSHASIDEVVYDDADFIFSDTAAEVSLFSHSATIPTGYTLRAIAVTARAKRGVSGPQSLQLAIRASGSNAFSSTKAQDVGYSANCGIWETNPTTSVAWVNGDLAALQIGVKSIA